MIGFFGSLGLAELRVMLRNSAGRQLLWLAIVLLFRRPKRMRPIRLRYMGYDWQVPDFLSFVYQLQDIYALENYRFRPTLSQPVILDCGANVGAAAIWFAQHYPNATITSYEADAGVYSHLQANLQRNAITKLRALHAAVWTNNQGVAFVSQGADAGAVVATGGQRVPSIRLRDVLVQHPVVDMLKMDIEGAETDVLLDCVPELHRVRALFVEYHSHKGSPQTLDQVLRVLTEAGFRYYLFARHNFKRRGSPLLHGAGWPGMDLNVDVFAYRA